MYILCIWLYNDNGDDDDDVDDDDDDDEPQMVCKHDHRTSMDISFCFLLQLKRV